MGKNLDKFFNILYDGSLAAFCVYYRPTAPLAKVKIRPTPKLIIFRNSELSLNCNNNLRKIKNLE